MIEEKSFNYTNDESHFVKYFDRLRSIDMSFDEIRTKLPELEDYYFDMVEQNVIYIYQRSIYELFDAWESFHK